MAYTSTNFKTKKEMVEAVNAGKLVTVYQPGPFGDSDITDGIAYIEGPHYPQPHKWYARVRVEAGYIVGVLK